MDVLLSEVYQASATSSSLSPATSSGLSPATSSGLSSAFSPATSSASTTTSSTTVCLWLVDRTQRVLRRVLAVVGSLTMGETAAYQRLQSTSEEGDYQCLPSDEEEEDGTEPFAAR
ncbi:unnamed protein product [Gadus morhua 'NCC']